MNNFLLVGWNNGNGFEYGYSDAKRRGTGYGNFDNFGYGFYDYGGTGVGYGHESGYGWGDGSGFALTTMDGAHFGLGCITISTATRRR